MDPTAAQERAGDVGTEMATQMVAKLIEAIAGFPHGTPDQRAAIASLVAEGMEEYADDLLGL